MRQIHLWPETAIEGDGSVTCSVVIEGPQQTRTHLWYRVPMQSKSLLTSSCDPFIVAIMFMAMSRATELVVHGEASPSLLNNLAEFQAAWAAWRPDRYQPVEITVEIEREQRITPLANQAIAPFSGGVDSCFTVFRHRTGKCGRLQRNLQTALMVHGFDIPLEQKQIFQNAAKKSQTILDSLGVALITMETNFRELKQDWEDAHGVGIASCLLMIQSSYTTGLIASTYPYKSLLIPWGSNPITDPLLSNQAFQIVHDGAAFTRFQKIQKISHWPEALQNIRVCWQGSHPDRNCGRCEKCIRTILGFRVAGVGLPPCFAEDVTEQQILELKSLRKSAIAFLEEVLQDAKTNGIAEPWMKSLQACIERNRRELVLRQFRQALKERLPLPVREKIQNFRKQWSARSSN